MKCKQSRSEQMENRVNELVEEKRKSFNLRRQHKSYAGGNYVAINRTQLGSANCKRNSDD